MKINSRIFFGAKYKLSTSWAGDIKRYGKHLKILIAVYLEISRYLLITFSFLVNIF